MQNSQENRGGNGILLGALIGGGGVFMLGVAGCVGLLVLANSGRLFPPVETNSASNPRSNVSAANDTSPPQTVAPMISYPVHFDPKAYETPVISGTSGYTPSTYSTSWLGQQTNELTNSYSGYTTPSFAPSPPSQWLGSDGGYSGYGGSSAFGGYGGYNSAPFNYSNSYQAPLPMTPWEYLQPNR